MRPVHHTPGLTILCSQHLYDQKHLCRLQETRSDLTHDLMEDMTHDLMEDKAFCKLKDSKVGYPRFRMCCRGRKRAASPIEEDDEQEEASDEELNSQADGSGDEQSSDSASVVDLESDDDEFLGKKEKLAQPTRELPQRGAKANINLKEASESEGIPFLFSSLLSSSREA